VPLERKWERLEGIFKLWQERLVLMKKRQVPVFQGSQNQLKTWHSQRPVLDLTGKRV